jgi:hypothetical protein
VAKSGLTFNPTKCKFSKGQVLFLGHLVDGEHIWPNPSKVAAVLQFPTPQNVEDVRRLLGVATYISKFIPRFSQQTSALRQLLKGDAASQVRFGQKPRDKFIVRLGRTIRLSRGFCTTFHHVNARPWPHNNSIARQLARVNRM